MEKHHNPRLNRFQEITANYLHTQEGRLYNYLLCGWKTAAQAERDLSLRISNITVFKRNLEKKGLLWVGEEVKCPVTGCKANLITTNPTLVSFDKLEVQKDQADLKCQQFQEDLKVLSESIMIEEQEKELQLAEDLEFLYESMMVEEQEKQLQLAEDLESLYESMMIADQEKLVQQMIDLNHPHQGTLFTT
ncbi:MAG: hypothetical protein IPK94_21015 [Saprospiraceae bacterium]|nr:hypothetical protein [Saprospiraceae bacterium]